MSLSWYRRASLPWLLALSAIVALFGAHAGRSWSFTVDDAAISFAYAKHLADGHGLVLNAGGERVEGASNLLWTLMLTPARALGTSHELLAKWLGVSLAGLALVGIALFPSALRAREPRYFDLVAPLLCALMPNYTIWAISGLENGLYAALAAAALLTVAREERDAERFPWSSVVLVLLFLTRPDGALYTVAIGLAKLLREIVPRKPRRQDVLWVLTIAAGVFATELFRLAYFAWPFPNTFYAKTRTFGLRESLLNPRSEGWTYLGSWLFTYKLRYVAALALAALLGPKPHGPRLAMLACTAAALLFPVATQGDWMGEYRFLTNASLLLSLALCEGARSAFTVLSRMVPRTARGALRWIATPIVAALVLKHAGRFYPSRYAIALQHNTLAMDTVASRLDYFVETSRRLGIDRRPSMLECDIGAPSYDGRFFIYDLVGLADVATSRSHPLRPPGLREAVFGEYQPDYLRIHGPFFGAFELTRLEEVTGLYFTLPHALNGRVDADAHYVRRALVSSPYAVAAQRLASSIDGAPDAVTLSHRRVEPRETVLTDVFLTGISQPGSTSVSLVNASGTAVERVVLEPLGGIIAPEALLRGERPRVRVRLVPPSAGRYRVVFTGAQSLQSVMGEIEASVGGSARDVAALDEQLARALADDRYDLAWNTARTLELQLAAKPESAATTAALARFARALAERAKIAADARAYAIASAIAKRARAIAPDDRRTLSLCGEVAERLADAAREDERQGRVESAFERARDAVLVDPRRSWSRRRAEELRPRRVHTYDGGRAFAAYRAAAEANFSGDGAEIDRAILFMASASQWLEAAMLAERAGHTPRDPHARIVVARGLLAQGRAREALALVSGVPCREARDVEVTLALRAILGAAAFRPFDNACTEPARPAQTLFDDRVGSFEGDSWAPWTVTGNAFAPSPTAISRCDYAINGYRGRAFAFSQLQCSVARRGALRSPSFSVQSEGLSFLVAGSSHPELTGVRLVRDGDGAVLLRAAGADHDGLRRVFWDLRAVHGQTVHVEIYDQASEGEWAYVMADDFREEPIIPAGVAHQAAR